MTLLHLLVFVLMANGLAAADGLKSKTTYAKAYGETRNAVSVDPSKDLPRLPAVEPSKAASTWKVRSGFELRLAAHEPQVRDPIALCFDERGRMFVCEMIDYSEMRDSKPHLGRISMLEDRDGDGAYETSRVFADDLPWPTGLCWANGALFVGATPDIWRFEDRDGDGRAERREVVYTGFGTGLKLLNVQGLMNSFQWGQDCRIHVLAGGGNRGEIRCLKRPELAAVELGGRDFWFDPVTLEFGLEQGGAQYGMSFDSLGRKFGCSNSDHLQHWFYDDRLTPSGSPVSLPAARGSIAVDGGAAEVFRISPDEPWRIIRTRWRIAGVVKGAVEGGGRVSGYFTGATGTTIYRGDAFGPDFADNSFTGDAGGQLIHRKIIRRAKDGIHLEGERPADERGFEFAASNDTWVRVVNFANAPDGCLLVCDMYREVIEHPWSIPDEIKQHLDLNQGNDRGRIWRITPKSGVPRLGRPVELHRSDVASLIATLSHGNGWHRDTAQRLLAERVGQWKASDLAPLLSQAKPAPALLALGLLDHCQRLEDRHLQTALDHPDESVVERAMILAATSKPARSQNLSAVIQRRNPRLDYIAALALPRLSPTSETLALQRTLIERSAPGSLGMQAVLAAAGDSAAALLDSLGVAHPAAPSLLEILASKESPDQLRSRLTALVDPAINPAQRLEGLLAMNRAMGNRRLTLTNLDESKRMHPLFTSAAALVADAKAATAQRVMALRLLALAPADLSGHALDKALSRGSPAEVQIAGIEAAASSLGAAATQRLLAKWGGLLPAARTAALERLIEKPQDTRQLLNAMLSAGADAPKPSDLPASLVQTLVASRDATLAALARKALKEVIPPSRAEAMATFQSATSLAGDAKAGALHYQSRCMACHKANGMGIEVGPPLATVKTKGRDALLTAILEPHKEVASAYIAYEVNTQDGRSLQGIIASDDQQGMTIRMMGGVNLTLPRNQIRGSRSSGKSLMPEGLEAGLKPQDMADLLSFIESAN